MNERSRTPTAGGATTAGTTRVDTATDTQIEQHTEVEQDVPGTGGPPSMGDLLGRTMAEISTLFHEEVELAKAELRVEVQKARQEIGKAQAEAKKAGEAAGKLGAAGVLGHLALLLVAFAAAWGLAALIPTGWAFLLVAVVVAAIALALYAAGRTQLKRVSFDNLDFRRIDPKPNQAIDELKETKQWAKQQ